MTSSSYGVSTVIGLAAQPSVAHPLQPGEHAVAEVGEQLERVVAGGGPAVEQGPAAFGLGAALQVDHPDPDQAVADHRPDRAQRGPHQRPACPRRRRRRTRKCLPRRRRWKGPPYSLSPTRAGAGPPRPAAGGDRRWRGWCRSNGHARRSTTTVSTAGAAPGDRDPMRQQRVGQRVGAVGPGLQVLAADQPHGQHVDRRGDRPDPQHPRARGSRRCGAGPGSARRLPGRPRQWGPR